MFFSLLYFKLLNNRNYYLNQLPEMLVPKLIFIWGWEHLMLHRSQILLQSLNGSACLNGQLVSPLVYVLPPEALVVDLITLWDILWWFGLLHLIRNVYLLGSLWGEESLAWTQGLLFCCIGWNCRLCHLLLVAITSIWGGLREYWLSKEHIGGLKERRI